ncbi:Cyclic nucleotide-gated cation channel beta-1 [Gossypium arboreum]|uniref:Cyclic nucleotide-gated cation channel beta-1 n=1 Tax=Gossypium arboreum TaxID=29729 RepID=A0A0B0PR15_GOSAR|nr:Cyclic nucleotide-gated cation channel beta-1 [Gossypium arboreum]
MRKWLTNCGLYVYIWCHDVAMAWKWECWSYDQPLAWLK